MAGIFPAACGVLRIWRPQGAAMRSGKYPAPWGGEVYSVVARAFVAKPEDFGTANPTLWDSVESDGLDPGPTTSSALH